MKTKVDIISGFLGAGKTTFIKKLVKDLYLQEKVVILENEFGRVNIDQETLVREGLTVKPIQAGCICCSSSMELSKGVKDIIEEYHPERIIIEPTGLAKLSEIKKLLSEQELQELCDIEHIITIVDAKNYYVRTMISKEFFEDQIRASRVMFLSRTNELQEDKLSKVIEEIHKIQPNCLIIDQVWDNISVEKLNEYIDNQTDFLPHKKRITIREHHPNDFDRYEIMTDYYSMEQAKQLIKELEAGRYGEIHRLKGICDDAELGLYSVDFIPGEMMIQPVLGSKEQHGHSKLCIIGRNLQKSRLEQLV